MDLNTADAFDLFRTLAERAKRELFQVTASAAVHAELKPDRTLVSNCDIAIDQALSGLVKEYGLRVVSEESAASFAAVSCGTYVTIDPIDGTLGYLAYVQHALEHGGIESFGKLDLGAEFDFTLLIGIIENGLPRYGASINYITNETIFVDAADSECLVWSNRCRHHAGDLVAYVDPRAGDNIEREILSVSGVSVITQATLGLKSLYALLGQHQSAVVCHRVQAAGVWDIAPAAAAARAFGGNVYDDLGKLVQFDRYAVLPGKGATILRGTTFEFVVDRLQEAAGITCL